MLREDMKLIEVRYVDDAELPPNGQAIGGVKMPTRNRSAVTITDLPPPPLPVEHPTPPPATVAVPQSSEPGPAPSPMPPLPVDDAPVLPPAPTDAVPVVARRSRPRSRGSEEVVRMTDVRATRPQFVWAPYIPRDCLTICEGEPGSRKSFLALQVASDVTQGRSILGTDPTVAPQNALLFSAEDDLGATVKRRLAAMGADQDRIIAVTKDLNLAQDADRSYFERLLRKHSPALVILDTMSVYVQVADSKARPILSKLAALARKYKTAILMLRHLRKAGGNAINRGYGSIHYIGAVRSAFAIVKNPLDDGQSVLIHSKSNLSETGPLVVFRITNGALARVIDSPLTPQDLLKPRQQERNEEAKEFLREALVEGPRPGEEIKAAASAAGISHATLRRAKDGIGVVVHKGGNRGPWTWELPADLEDAHA